MEMEMEEEGVVQPPPLVEEEVVQPPPMMQEEDVVVQPPPLVVEEEVHPLVEAVLPPADALARIYWELGDSCRRHVATRAEDVIRHCEEAHAKLHEALRLLIGEPLDAGEILYADLLREPPSGLFDRHIGAAASIVDSIMTWPGPLSRSIQMALDIVGDTFRYSADQQTAPIHEACSDLQDLIVAHSHAGNLVDLYVGVVGPYPIVPDGDEFDLDIYEHYHRDAENQARRALGKLNVALDRIHDAYPAFLSCKNGRFRCMQQEAHLSRWVTLTMDMVEHALELLRGMRNSLVLVERAKAW